MNTNAQLEPIDHDDTWSDSKRYLWLLSPGLPLIGLAAVALFMSTGWTAVLFFPLVIVYAVIPALDWLIGEDESNPPEKAVKGLEGDRYYQAVVAAFIPSQYATTLLAAYVFAAGDLSALQMVGMVLAVGWLNGIAINTAHELCHKKSSVERWLAKITLAPVAYGHFYVEHVRGHHKNVSTPMDPASSKIGESFWAFLPRTMIGSVRSAWAIEKARLERKGSKVMSWENDNIQAWAITVVLFAAIAVAFGPLALVFLFVQAFFGAALLEVVNYVEHYGLLRQKDASGRFERCKPEHSWNSNHIVTNLVLYQLQRHSDHHANPARRFQALRHFDNTPQLPSGYAGMILVAYFPPLWRALMDKRVAAHFKGDMTRANIHPPARDKIMAKWHNPVGDVTRSVEQAPEQHAESQNASNYQCPDCSYIYSVAAGCPQEGFPMGTKWTEIPNDWSCPDCAVRDKVDFLVIS